MDDRTVALRLTPVSCETLARLDAYVALLHIWQKRTNLVAPSTLPDLWRRHVADSLQLLPLAPDARTWLDIGSGGGFPGVVLACALAETPGVTVHLVERNGKKAAFLREAIRVTKSPGIVHHGDLADCVQRIPTDIDVVTARAVAPLAALIAMAYPWLQCNARALFLKGQDIGLELHKATTYSTLNITVYPSLTGNGHIVEIRTHGGRRHPDF